MASERDIRQLRLMDDRLREFLSGSRSIDQVISDLEGLLHALEETSDDWKQAFREQWGELEVAFALAVGNDDPLPDASVPELRDAAERMLGMVESQMPLG